MKTVTNRGLKAQQMGIFRPVSPYKLTDNMGNEIIIEHRNEISEKCGK
jgi:predicted transcriptional regulator